MPMEKAQLETKAIREKKLPDLQSAEARKRGTGRVPLPALPRRAQQARRPRSAVPRKRVCKVAGQVFCDPARARTKKRRERKIRERNSDHSTTVSRDEKEWTSTAM